MAVAQSHSYTLHLPQFEGPLDVLLRLIEKQELAISAISVTLVADQYLAYVRDVPHPQPSAMAEFLALAAQLVLIKSRSLLPRPETSSHEADSAEDLAQQLREYQIIKHAVEQLQAWQASGQRSWERLTPPPRPEIATPELPSQSIDGLIKAIQRRLELVKPVEDVAIPIPRPKPITIALVCERLFARLERQAYCSFEDLLDAQPTRADIIVSLWTILEQYKRLYINVEQDYLYSIITLGRGPDFEKRPISFTDPLV